MDIYYIPLQLFAAAAAAAQDKQRTKLAGGLRNATYFSNILDVY